MELQQLNLVMIPQEDLLQLRSNQEEILKEIKNLQTSKAGAIPINNITAKEFMSAVRICRSKFDQLVSDNKIKTIKKKRKIYVPSGEIERYFNDPSIQ
ncbi:MAG: hypothetical protein ACO1OO_04515 [Flavisolibacter sp.]